MKNILKILLKRGRFYNRSSEYYTEVKIEKSLKSEDIITELIKDGLVDNRELALKFLENYNKKTAEILFNGNTIDTGLVILSPKTTGVIYEKKWNPNYNNIAVILKQGVELSNALMNTEVEISVEDEASCEEETKNTDEDSNLDFSTSSSDVPPCGLAFRNWILKN